MKATEAELAEIQAKRIAEARRETARDMATRLQDQVRRITHRIEATTGVKVASVTVDCADSYVTVVKLDGDE